MDYGRYETMISEMASINLGNGEAVFNQVVLYYAYSMLQLRTTPMKAFSQKGLFDFKQTCPPLTQTRPP